MKLKDLKTTCCHADFVRVGRARYECEKCKKDVSLEFVFLVELFSDKLNGVKEKKKEKKNE